MSRSRIVASTAVVLAVALTAFARAPRQAPPPQAAPQMTIAWVATLTVGTKWDATKAPQQQVGFADHVAGVGKLAEDRKLLVGGPFFENVENHKVTGALWVVQAESADAAKKIVESDAWVKGDLMKIESVRAFMAAGGAWLGASKAAPPAGK